MNASTTAGQPGTLSAAGLALVACGPGGGGYGSAGDSGAGAVPGRGVKGIWWAVTPAGAEIAGAPVSTGY